MSDIVIRAEGLGKKYRIGASAPYHRFSELLSGVGSAGFGAVTRPFRRPSTPAQTALQADPTEFWALKDVNFEVKQGEVVGVIGRNGAGKSTLLKVLSRITEPTTGRFGVRGRVASLLEVGTGFHPELTGRENIFVSGILLGMTRAEVKRRFDEIVAFSGVEQFLDTPVKRYSSGMQVRLGFAVAAHLESEILIIDEVLAVGDAEFQKKCLGKMGDVAKSGRTVLFVSHNMGAIGSLCTAGLHLTEGNAHAYATAVQAIEAHLRGTDEENQCEWRGDFGNHWVRFKSSWVREVNPSGVIATSSQIEIGAEIELLTDITGLVFGLRLYSEYGHELVYRLFDDFQSGPIQLYRCGKVARSIVIPPNTLACGRYRVGFEVGVAWKEVVVRDAPGSLSFSVEDYEMVSARYPVRSLRGFNSLFRPAWRVNVLD